MAESSEYRRKTLHIGVGAFALLLRYLTWWQAALCAIGAFVFNAWILPACGGRNLWREADRARGHPTGILVYPISLLCLFLLFHDRLHLAAAAWGIMAVGDGMASVFGTAMGSAKLPWNRTKSWAGSIAMLVFGAPAAVGLAWWTSRGEIDLAHAAILICVISLVAVLIESVDSPLDDNISVPIGGGLLLYLLCMIDSDRWSEFATVSTARDLAWAVGINAVFASLAYLARSLDSWGSVGGFLVGSSTWFFGGYRSFLMLFAFFVLGSSATKIGYRRKAAAGLAQEKGGSRSLKHVLANGGLVPLFAILSSLTRCPEYFLIGLAAALATAASDTVSSEIGQLYGRRTCLITTFRPVPRGTNGAVSLEGTLAGAFASLLVSLLGFVLGLYTLTGTWIVVVAAFLGTLFESYLGATLERRGYLNNELTNFLNTVAGAAAAMGLLRLAA